MDLMAIPYIPVTFGGMKTPSPAPGFHGEQDFHIVFTFHFV